MNDPSSIQDITPSTIKQINEQKYESVTLTAEEEKAALFEAKKKKYFKEKPSNKAYWALSEKDYGIE